MFTRSEISTLVIAILVVGLAFGFDDGRDVFEWSSWLGNLVTVIFLVAIALTVQQLGHKIVARLHGFEAVFSLWGVQQFRFAPAHLMGRVRSKPFPRRVTFFGKSYLIESFPIGIALSLLVMILSAGKWFFVAVGQYTLLIQRSARFGRRFIEVTNYEEAKIALAGPMANIILMTLAAFVNQYGLFDKFIAINGWLALFHMLPVSQLAGTKVYFGSRLLYVSSLAFMIAMFILVFYLSVIPLLVISLLSVLVIGSLYYYYTYFQ